MLKIKIRKEIVEKYIQEFAKAIKHMDGRELPMVILELQAEEAKRQDVKDHKTITAFSKESLKKVFTCWFLLGKGNDWFAAMAKEEGKEEAKEETKMGKPEKKISPKRKMWYHYLNFLRL